MNLQGNALRVLPPELGKLRQLCDAERAVLRLEANPFITEIVEKLMQGDERLFEYLQSAAYAERLVRFASEPPVVFEPTDKKKRDKTKAK